LHCINVPTPLFIKTCGSVVSRVSHIIHPKNTLWPVEKKIEVVTSWLTLGNLRQAAAIGGMSHSLVKQWRTQPWWKDLEAEILASRRIASASKLSKIVDKSLDVIDDRLENGDFVYNAKTGDLLRKPVSMRDAGNVANTLMQRQAILEKLTRDETVAETAVSIQDQLSNLAAEFAKMNTKIGRTQAVEEIEYKETYAVHEERPEDREVGSGLPPRGGQLYEQAGDSEEADGAECSTSSDGKEGLGT